MKNKTFNYKFGIIPMIIFPVVALTVLPTVIYNILKLCGVGELFSFSPTGDVLLIIVGLVVLGIAIYTFFGSKYTITNDTLTVNIAFFKTKIKIKDIKQIIYYRETNFILLFYLNIKVNDLVFTKICIKDSRQKEFVDSLIEIAPNIRLELDKLDLPDSDDLKDSK